MSEPQKSEDFLANTGCPRIGVPNLSAHKMVFFWDLWPEILNLEISHIYILLTMSSFSNISIKNWFLDTCFLNWDLANLGHLRPTLSIWLKKMPTIGLFDVKGTRSRYQLSYLIMKVIILGSKGYILLKKWRWRSKTASNSGFLAKWQVFHLMYPFKMLK